MPDPGGTEMIDPEGQGTSSAAVRGRAARGRVVRARAVRTVVVAGFGLAGAAGGVLEVLAVQAWWGQRTAEGFLLHLGATLLLTPFLVALRPRELRRPWWAGALFTGLQLVVLPVIGPVLLTLFHLLALRLHPPEDPFGAFEFHRPPYADALHGKQQETLDAPLLELLPTMETTRRRQAVLSLANLEPRKAVPILRQATRDADEEVRLLAYGILNTIEDRLNRQLLESRDAQKNGEAAASATAPGEESQAHAVHRNGDLYYEFFYLGLAGQQTQRFYLEHAARCYQRSLELEADQPRVQLKLARVFIGLRQLERAQECLVAATLGGVPIEETMPWQAEIYFQDGEFKLLAETAGALRREPRLSATMKQAVDYWS